MQSNGYVYSGEGKEIGQMRREERRWDGVLGSSGKKPERFFCSELTER